MALVIAPSLMLSTTTGFNDFIVILVAFLGVASVALWALHSSADSFI